MSRLFSRMLFTILAFLFILSILVIVHETGHFITAKYFGVKVEEFGFGFPPRAKTLFTTKDGVAWTLNWLPIGGFVKLKGENGEAQNEPDSFGHKAPWKRVLILSAGVILNLILAFVLLIIGYSVGWPQDLTNGPPKNGTVLEQNVMVIAVQKDSPAYLAGIRVGDVIHAINGIPTKDVNDLPNRITGNEGQPITLTFDQNGTKITQTVTPQELTYTFDEETTVQEPIKKVGIGVALGVYGVVRFPIHRAIILGAQNTVLYVGKITAAFYHLFKDLIVARKISPAVGGPVMIATLSGKVARMGLVYLIQFLALLSLNLAIINILPIPALDGGRVLFVVIEKIKGRAVSMQFETLTHVIGFWVLIALTVLITMRDIARFEIWDKIKNIIAS